MSTDDKILLDQDERRKYEFRDEAKAIYQTEKGLSEETVREISKIKGEPEFMLKFRLAS